MFTWRPHPGDAGRRCRLYPVDQLRGERWEFAEAGDGSTLVTLHSWRDRPGLDGWTEKLFGSKLRTAIVMELQKRLMYVQFRVENPR